MIDAHNFIEKEKVPAAMLLQVHDELVFEVEKSYVKEFAAIVEKIMADAMPLKVPVVVDSGWGDNWLEAHE